MESRKDELQKLPIEEIRRIARDKGLKTSGLKSKLIDNILKDEQGQKATKGRKTLPVERIKREEKEERKTLPIKERIEERREPEATIYNVPIDIKKLSAIKLEYPELLRLCSTSKELSGICRDPKFWQAKINRDFSPGPKGEDYPKENISRLKGPQFRAKYEQLYVNEINMKINSLYKEMNKEIKKIKAKYTPDIENLEINKNRLIQRSEKLVTRDNDRKYIEFRRSREDIQNIEGSIGRLIMNNHNAVDDMFESFRYSDIDLGQEEDFKAGNLIGIVEGENPNKHLPEILIYIYSGKNDLLFDYSVGIYKPLEYYPYKLIESMEKDGYTIDDIPDIYRVLFDTKGFKYEIPLTEESDE